MATLNVGQTSVVIPTRNINAGLYPSPEYDIGAGVNAIRLRVARNSWPDLGNGVPVVEGQFLRSLDGGANWIPCGSFAADGGVRLDKFGAPYVFSEIVIENSGNGSPIIVSGMKLKCFASVIVNLNSQVEIGVS